MAVGNIKCRQRVDGARERRDRRVVASHPELMAHAVIGGNVDSRLAGGGARQHGIDLRRRRISQHDRAGLGIDRFDLADAIVFLGDRRQFVLADAIAGVSGDRRHRGKAGLHMTAPSQPVHIVTRLVVAAQDAGADHALQILGGFGIDRGVIGIDRRGQVDLRFGDVQEAPRPAFDTLARLGAGQHIVGRRQNFAGASRRRPQRAKGLYQGQVGALFRCGMFIRANPDYVKVVSEPEIILIAGPTASGKSALALALAEKLRGVIVNADSMQVYRDLRIITARPTAKEEQQVPHRLYGRSRRGGELFGRPLAHRGGRDAGDDQALWARGHRRRRHRALLQCADPRARRGAADPGRDSRRRARAARARASTRCIRN